MLANKVVTETQKDYFLQISDENSLKFQYFWFENISARILKVWKKNVIISKSVGYSDFWISSKNQNSAVVQLQVIRSAKSMKCDINSIELGQ